MQRAAIALLCIALATSAHARGVRTYSSSTYSSYSTQGAALRTTRAGLVKWAAAPTGYTLGTYHSAAPSTAHGVSPARQQHIHNLRTCNPFANVTATAPLAPC
jgi:hypothetical protein